jgi:hypothetical protein
VNGRRQPNKTRSGQSKAAMGNATGLGRAAGTVDSLQCELRPLLDRGATSPVIAARAANTNIAASRRTTHRRVPHGPKPPQKPLLDRPRRPPRRLREHQSTRRTSLGRRLLVVASSSARGRHARSVAAERGHPGESGRVQSARVAVATNRSMCVMTRSGSTCWIRKKRGDRVPSCVSCGCATS